MPKPKMKVKIRNEYETISPRSPEFNEARRRNQQMLQELHSYRQEVAQNRNSPSVRRITRKANEKWGPGTSRIRAFELAYELGMNVPQVLPAANPTARNMSVLRSNKSNRHKRAVVRRMINRHMMAPLFLKQTKKNVKKRKTRKNRSAK
jgi:hypothetical protein